jgi:microsomal dipeptidase-like Zn-dependent dipeptidase
VRLAGVLRPPSLHEALSSSGLPPGASLDGLAGPEDYPGLAAALRARRWDETSIEAVMGRNLLRFLRSALPH